MCVLYRIPFPYIHDLAALITILINNNISVPDPVKESAKLTRFAIATRYPHILSPVSEDEYLRVIRIAEDVVRWSENAVKEKMGV